MLRERLRFERRVEQDNGAGTLVGDWVPVFVTSARVKPLTGTEQMLASRLAGQGLFEITIRDFMLPRQVTPEWRAADTRTTRVYNIRAIVNPDEKGAYLIMTAESGVVSG
jgi:head-tail adaptor